MSSPGESVPTPAPAFTITTMEGVGRCLVAARDISALEEILVDQPAMVAPYYDPQPMCLECLRKTDGTVSCPRCGLPLCGEKECEAGPAHRLECQYFTNLASRLQIPRHAQNTPYLVSVLRLLAVRDQDPAMWARLDLLMDHLEELEQQVDAWSSVQENIVQWLLRPEKGGLQGVYTSQEINRAIGLIQTNAINMEKPWRGDIVSCKALYPTFSFVSHSCVSNARVVFNEDSSIRLRAQVDIKEGEEITIQYISHLFSNIVRREEILSNWMFQCSCSRCEDPSELGTDLGTLLCSQCDGGHTLPEDNSYQCQVWRCQECGHTMPSQEVKKLSQDCEQKMMELFETETDQYRQLLEFYSKIFHQNHFQILLLKKYLARSLKGKLTIEEIEEKVGLMKDYVDVFSRIDPGYTKWRGMMLVEISKLSIFLADYRLSNKKITEDQFQEKIQDCLQELDFAMKSLSFEPDGSEAAHYYLVAQKTYKQLRDVLEFSKLLKIK